MSMKIFGTLIALLILSTPLSAQPFGQYLRLQGLPQNGYIEIPDRPGLGIDLNIEEVLKHPYQQENYLPLFKPGWELRRTQSS